MQQPVRPKMNWAEFLAGESLFVNAIRLQALIWTIQEYAVPGARLLEVGCGSGSTALLLADLGYHVTATDIDPSLLDSLRNRCAMDNQRGSITVEEANAFRLPWSDRPFDLAYHQGVLEHFTDEQIVTALEEQGRIAELVIFDVPNNRHRDQPFGDERCLPVGYWRKLLKQARLRVVACRGRGFPKWTYALPHLFFARWALRHTAWFGRRFGESSVFVCRSLG